MCRCSRFRFWLATLLLLFVAVEEKCVLCTGGKRIRESKVGCCRVPYVVHAITLCLLLVHNAYAGAIITCDNIYSWSESFVQRNVQNKKNKSRKMRHANLFICAKGLSLGISVYCIYDFPLNHKLKNYFTKFPLKRQMN